MQNRPILQSIDHDGPIRLTKVGRGHDGFVWTVQPDRFDSVVEMINRYGGPGDGLPGRFLMLYSVT